MNKNDLAREIAIRMSVTVTMASQLEIGRAHV